MSVRLAGLVAGAVTTRRAFHAVTLAAGDRPELWRVNFRGGRVSLAAGPALALGATAGAVSATEDPRTAAAAAVAGLGAGLVGGYDDVVGNRPGQRASKGFSGHLAALKQGRVTAGVVKIVGIGAASLAAAALLERAPARRGRCRRTRGVADVLIDAGVIAGTANLVNLLDLRPGRAAKAGMLLAAPLVASSGPGAGVAAAAAGAAAGVLPDDLAERAMLGDTGANALGALLGTALVARRGRLVRMAALAGIVGLTAASERVSFTKVIAKTPVLRELDALGRRTG